VTHLRKLIRAKVVERLEEASVAGGRVFRSRVRELDDDELPCVMVYADEEEATPLSTDQGARDYRKELTLHVKCVASGETADEDLDDLCEQVEDEIERDQLLEDLADELTYLGFQQGAEEEGERTHVSAVLRFRVVYHERHPRVIETLPDFEEVEGGIDVTGDGVPEIQFKQTVEAP
jgi:hypothetical protein